MPTVTYHSTNAVVPWIAYALLPDGTPWQVRCEGATEAEASQRAEALLISEQAKWKRLIGSSELEEGTKQTSTSELPTASSWGDQPSGRGACFAGKIWVFNRATGDKRRIDPNELDSYLGNGYIKAGPRTK